MNEAEKNKFIRHMADELTIEISKKVELQFESLVKPRLDVIQKQIDTVQRGVDRIDHDLAEDRKDIGNLKTEMGTIRNQFNEIRELFSQQTRTIVNKVEDKIEKGLEDATNMVTETTAAAVDATLESFVAGKPKIVKKARSIFGWLKFWRWFRKR